MTDTRPRLGYVGLGLMGGPMATRLCRAGFPLTVWNRRHDKTEPLVALGARAATSPAEVARASDIVFTCLLDTDAVEAVVFGPNGIAEGAGSGTVLVDFSSMRPDKTAAFAERLRTETGMGWIDAPVSGGVPGATNGTLVVMAGGDAGDFERVTPVVAHLSSRFTLMGSNGSGQTTKLINQMIAGCGFVVLAEACQLAQDAGIDAARLPEALAGGRADSPLMQQYMARMAQGDETVEARIALMVKDLNTVMDEAQRLGAALPMTGLATEIHKLLARRGLADADNAATVRFYDKE